MEFLRDIHASTNPLSMYTRIQFPRVSTCLLVCRHPPFLIDILQNLQPDPAQQVVAFCRDAHPDLNNSHLSRHKFPFRLLPLPYFAFHPLTSQIRVADLAGVQSGCGAFCNFCSTGFGHIYSDTITL